MINLVTRASNFVHNTVLQQASHLGRKVIKFVKSNSDIMSFAISAVIFGRLTTINPENHLEFILTGCATVFFAGVGYSLSKMESRTTAIITTLPTQENRYLLYHRI